MEEGINFKGWPGSVTDEAWRVLEGRGETHLAIRGAREMKRPEEG